MTKEQIAAFENLTAAVIKLTEQLERFNGTTAAPAEAAKPVETKPIDYPQIAAAIGRIVKEKGRETAVEVLAKFKAKTGKDLKPEQYAAFLAAAEHPAAVVNA